jgi:hypothetical protein
VVKTYIQVYYCVFLSSLTCFFVNSFFFPSGASLSIYYSAGAVFGSGFGALGLLFLSIEFFCIRFMCSIPLTVVSFLLAALGWAFAFVMYTSDKCHPADFSIYNCDLGDGGVLGLVAFCSYLVCAVMTCFVPKAQPVLRKLQEMEFTYDHSADPCDCCVVAACPRNPFCKKRQKEPEAEEEEELLVPLDGVEVDGQIYKQYHDEKAGITLQNQYTAAYNRWLVLY